MNFDQYVPVGSTVRSFKDSGKLDAEFRDGMLLWKRG